MIVAGVIFGKTQGLLRESFLERFGPLCICVVKVCLFLRESKSVSFYEFLCLQPIAFGVSFLQT